MSYKEDQAATREALQPRLIERNFGYNRRQRRSVFRSKDRSFTRPGPQVSMTDISGEVHYKQAKHVINDYAEQRNDEDQYFYQGTTNHERHYKRQVFRKLMAEREREALGGSHAA